MEAVQSDEDDNRVSTVSSDELYRVGGNHGIQLSHRSSAFPIEMPSSDLDAPRDTSVFEFKPKKYQLVRIIAVIALPFSILIPLAVFYFTDAVSVTTSETRLRDIMEQRLSRTIVNYLQTERFYSSLYLTRSNDVDISILVRTIRDTDTVLNGDSGIELEATIAKHQYAISKLRQSVISGEIMEYECSERYSRIIDSMISDLLAEINSASVGRFSQTIAAYYYFLRYEEQFSITRINVATKFLSSDPHQDRYYLDRLVKCLRGTAFLETSLRYSNTIGEAYRISVERKIRYYNSFDILKDFLLNKSALGRDSIELYIEWLNVTSEISTDLNAILHRAEIDLIERIDIDISSSQVNTAVFAILLSSLVCSTPIILYLFVGMSARSLDLSRDLGNQVQELEQERKRADTLLYQMLPKDVAEQLKQSCDISAVMFDSVTIYFSEVDNFTKICAESTAIEVVMMLNTLYRVLDSKVDEYDAYKVETINDAYMLASGLPKRNGDRHVYEICSLAIELRDRGEELSIPHRHDEKFRLKIGINTGPCAAGIVGSILPRYCLFGDTINTASRMESTGQASKIHLSPDTYGALSVYLDEFHVESRGVVCVKGKGEMSTYWLLGKRGRDEPSTGMDDERNGTEQEGATNG